MVDATITMAWIQQNPGFAERYKTYSAGRLKLLAAHWLALDNPEADSWRREYAVHLEELASTEQSVAILPVELSNWNGKDIRRMADEVGLKELYDLAYSPLSAAAHAEWMVLRTNFMMPCEEPLHPRHWLPIFQRPSLHSKVPIAATGHFLQCVRVGLDSLSLEYDEKVWTTVGSAVEKAAELSGTARAAMARANGAD
jgi:hypothetical protein